MTIQPDVPDTKQWKRDYISLERTISSFESKYPTAHPELIIVLDKARSYLMAEVFNCLDAILDDDAADVEVVG